MGTLRAVLFDVDDTLFSTTHFAALARRRAVEAMVAAGLDLPVEVVLKELDEVIAEFSSNYDHHFDQLLRRLRPRSFPNVNPAVIVASGVTAYHDTKYEMLAPFDDVVPLLQALTGVGCIAGVVTHGWTTKQAEKIVRLGLLPHLSPEAIFISDQIGISKPNPKLYTAALDKLGLSPSQAMYVGDSPTNDIAPPRSLGMKTVWARRSARNSLEGTGIEADHIVDDFVELRGILREVYGLEV